MARTFAHQRIMTARVLASPEHQAYDWALKKVAYLPRKITTTRRETEEDWWALLRVVWKVRLGRDPSKPARIGEAWVIV